MLDETEQAECADDNIRDLALAFAVLVGVLVLMAITCAVTPVTPSGPVPPAVRKASCIRDGRVGR